MEKKIEPEEKDNLAVHLIKKIKNEDDEALKEFFHTFSDDIYNFPIRNFQFNEDEAGDFYLFVFERLKDGKKLKKFAGKSKFRTWFFSVLRNFSIDYLRWKNNRTIYELPQGDIEKMENLIYEYHHENENEIEELMDSLELVLDELTDYERIVFKLVFIFYTFINENDMKILQSISGKSRKEIIKTINKLKETAIEKSDNVSGYEESANRLFMDIIKLEKKIRSFFDDNPQLEKNIFEWNENYENSNYPLEINEIISKLMKKKKAHANILLQYNKNMGGIRVPYKNIASLLKTTDKIVSVQFLRIIQKLDQRLVNSGFFY